MPLPGNIILTQGTGGGFTCNITGYTVKYRNNESTLTATVGAIDILSYFYDGTNLYITIGLNY